MVLLLLGLALWVLAHFFRRLAPGAREAMTERMGNASKGVVAIVLVLSVVLIVIGYRGAPFVAVYTPPVWTVHLTDLVMILAIALFGLGSSKSQFRGRLRHPQLSGFALWAGLHLTVNGDLASVVMFGTFLVWALAEMVVLNRTEPRPESFEGGSWIGTIRLLVISLVLYAVITAVHTWLGVSPFPK